MPPDADASFDSWWSQHYAGVAPAGFALRPHLPHRWLRLHNLTAPKRYPTSHADQIELLARHQEVTASLFDTNDPCWVVLGGFASHPGPVDPHYTALLPELEFERALASHPHWMTRDPDDSLAASVASTPWSFERFTSFILAVADDAIGFTAFVSRRSGEIYAPYAGGIDLIVSTADRRDLLFDRWPLWRSPRPDGL